MLLVDSLDCFFFNSLRYYTKIILISKKRAMQKRHNPLPSSLVITVVSLVVALLIFKPSSVFAEIDTGAALKSLCNELEKDTKLFQVDFEMAKCTCVQMPDACKELETLPYNFDTTCNKLLDQLLPETFKGLVTCSCAMFDNACQWFKKANDDSSGKSSVVSLEF